MASLGAELKQAREERGVTLEELSQSTKIGTRLLRALEQDRYDELPGGIFTKGFIRAYARAVGVDDEKAIADYLAAVEPRQPEAQSTPALANRIVEVGEQPSADLPWGWLALLLVAAAIGLTAWGVHSRVSRRRSDPAIKPSTTPATEPAPASNQTVAATRADSPASAKSEAPAEKTANPAAVAPSANGYFAVHVKVREDSWMSITSDGKTVLEGTITAPAVKSIKARNQIVVKAGNVGGLDFEFNGALLPPQGGEGETKSLVFGSSGLEATEMTPAAQP